MGALNNPLALITNPTTISEAIAFLQRAPKPNLTLHLATATDPQDLAAGGGGAWAAGAYQYTLCSAATGANAAATVGGYWRPKAVRPAGDNTNVAYFNWDKWLIVDMRVRFDASVGDEVRYVKLSQDTTHAALGSKGIGIASTGLVFAGGVYDTSLHPQASIFTAVVATGFRITIVHIPGGGEFILKDLTQVMADTTNLLSGNGTAAATVLHSMQSVTAVNSNLAMFDVIGLYHPSHI